MAIVVPIVSEWNPKGLDRSIADIQKAEGAWGKAGVAIQKAAVPAGIAVAALAGAAYKFAQAAIEDQASAARLAQGLAKTTGATKAQVAATEEWISAQGKALGVADDQLRPAIQKLASASGDLGQAQKDAALAMDIAASAGVDVETAAKAIAKAYDGSRGSLKKLVPGLDAATLKSGDMAAVFGELEAKVGGAAEAFAETDAGALQRFQLGMAEAGEAIGAALLPALEAVLPYLQGFATWAQENTQTLLIIGGVIGGVAGGILAINAAMKIWQATSVIVTGAQWALNAAMAANPIGLVVIAIAALIGALVLAYKKVDWFRAFVDKAWDVIYTAIEFVVTWFKETAWPILETVFGWIVEYVKTVARVYKTAWDTIYRAVEVVWTWLRDTFGPFISKHFEVLKTGVEKVGTAFTVAFGFVKTAVSTAWDFIRPIIEKIANGIKTVIDGVRSLPGVSAILGDAQRAVNRTASVGVTGYSRSGNTVNIHVTAGVGDPIAIGRQVENVMRSRRVRLGVA